MTNEDILENEISEVTTKVMKVHDSIDPDGMVRGSLVQAMLITALGVYPLMECSGCGRFYYELKTPICSPCKYRLNH